MTQFLGKKYMEYLIEYDNINNSVYVNGMTPEGFWEEISTEDDIADPESYAWGVHDTLVSTGFKADVVDVDFEDEYFSDGDGEID